MALIDAVKPAVHYQSYLTDGAVVATYSTPWGAKTEAKAGTAVSYFTWPGVKVRRSLTLASVTAPVEAGRQVGHLSLTLGEQSASVPVTTASSLDKPGIRWRLTRIS
jgi:hypothetical protein